MRKLRTVVLLYIIFVLFISSESSKSYNLVKMGGFIDTMLTNNDLIFKCGKNNDLICWTHYEDGRGKVPGEPLKVFFHNPQNTNLGIGYINVMFISESGGDEINGPSMTLRILETTEIYYDYLSWYQNVVH